MSDQVTQLSFRPADLLEQYQSRDFDRLSETLLDILRHFRTNTYYVLDKRMSYFINAFVKHFLYLFTQEDYIPSDAHMARFIDSNPIIANLVAMSAFGTTDPFVEILLSQKRNFAKVLALYSPRNRLRLNRKILFDTEPGFATQWYFAYMETYKTGSISAYSLANLREHILFQDGRFKGINAFIHHAYFGCTYIDPERDYLLKSRINELVCSWAPAQQHISNTPKPGRIAVLTSMWFPRQSVYRSQYGFLERLARDYELVLVHLGAPREDLDTGLFSEVRRYQVGRNATDLGAVNPNDFAMAYFPDVGMTIESIVLANMRLAPIQVTNYGHPVSTFGSQIDYWIGGADTEISELADENFSERLVLIPGCAQVPASIQYECVNPPLAEAPILINCAWTGQKINFDHLCRLRAILERAERPVRLRFFPGGAVHNNGYLPMKKEIEAVLGAENVEVFRDLPYKDYMRAMESAHFALDSYPFGGYNTAIDILYLRKPLVALVGERFYNMASAYLLRQLGVEALIAGSEQAYIDLGVRMINDAAFRQEMSDRLQAADLEATILSQAPVEPFKRAIDYLFANHDWLVHDENREPIIIE